MESSTGLRTSPLTVSDEVGHAAAAEFVEVVAHEDLSIIESLFGNEVPFVAGMAVDAFVAVASLDDIPRIRAMLKSRNANEREAAVRAAGKLALRELVTEIRPMLEDESELVRVFAAEVLGKLGIADDWGSLERMVRDQGEVSDARASALDSVAELAEPKDFDRMVALIRNLEEDEPGMFDRALERIATRGQISRIEPLLIDDSLLSRAAARAFAMIAIPEDRQKLSWMLANGNVGQKIAALLAVGRLRQREFLPVVKSLLEDPDWDVANAAADSFPELVIRDDLEDVLAML